MRNPASRLDDLRVASPCPASWADMKGDDRVRHCLGCRKNVYNLSAMTRPQAEALVQETEGRLCVRFYRRPDGTILTADCPVGLRAVQRRMARLAGALAAAFLGIFAAGCGRTQATAPVPGPVPAPTHDPAIGFTGVEMGGPRLSPTMGDTATPQFMGEACPPTPR